MSPRLALRRVKAAKARRKAAELRAALRQQEIEAARRRYLDALEEKLLVSRAYRGRMPWHVESAYDKRVEEAKAAYQSTTITT